MSVVKKRRFVVEQLVQNPGNLLEQNQGLRGRVDGLERSVVSYEAGDERYRRAAMSLFHVHKDGDNQGSIPINTWTKVTWVTRAIDRYKEFDLTENRFIAQRDGIYELRGVITWVTTASGVAARTSLYKNGLVFLHGPMAQASSANSLGCWVSGFAQLVAGDRIEVYGWHTSIGDNDRIISGAANETYFFGRLIE